jgi:glycosyltransferase involved in cell wall biosynthesis
VPKIKLFNLKDTVMRKIKILHITPHLGGGMLSAYAGITKDSNEFEHEVLLLEEPQKPEQLDKIKKNGCKIVQHSDNISDLMRKADIVQINWWHHPVMCNFLHNFPPIPVRSCLWVHVSGCAYPYLRRKFIEKFDFSFFATKKSYNNPEIASLSEEYLLMKTRVIYGMGDIDSYLSIERENSKKFNVGYVGTIALSKIHPEFIEFCANAQSDDIKFIVVGDDNNKNHFADDIKKYNLEEQIDFWGFRKDMHNVYAQFDVFGYPLNPMHFGATENVLLEAMAAGLPVVALRGGVEEIIVEDGKTGILVSNKAEYGDAIRYLYSNKQIRCEMGENARKSVISRFNADKNRENLYSIYHELMNNDKRKIEFSNLWGKTPSDWFLFAVEKEKELFEKNDLNDLPYIFKEHSKSSVFHFAREFPIDEKLNIWVNQLKKNSK